MRKNLSNAKKNFETVAVIQNVTVHYKFRISQRFLISISRATFPRPAGTIYKKQKRAAKFHCPGWPEAEYSKQSPASAGIMKRDLYFTLVKVMGEAD